MDCSGSSERLIGQETVGDAPFYGWLLAGIARRYRSRRKRLFSSLISIDRRWRVLDLGCGNAKHAWFAGVAGVVGLDLLHSGEKPYALFVRADSTVLPFSDKSFDFVFSNSLLEHLPTWEEQRRCADEIRRVGFGYWVQVPNRHFPVDPHYIVPFFQYLPEPAMRWWARHLPLGWHKKNTYFERVRCLSFAQMRALFPEATIMREKAAGMTKSFVALLNPSTTKQLF